MDTRIYDERVAIDGTHDFWENRASNTDLENLKSVLLNVNASDEATRQRNEKERTVVKKYLESCRGGGTKFVGYWLRSWSLA